MVGVRSQVLIFLGAHSDILELGLTHLFFESARYSRKVIGRRICHYNTELPHQALGYQVPAQIAVQGVQQ